MAAATDSKPHARCLERERAAVAQAARADRKKGESLGAAAVAAGRALFVYIFQRPAARLMPLLSRRGEGSVLFLRAPVRRPPESCGALARGARSQRRPACSFACGFPHRGARLGQEKTSCTPPSPRMCDGRARSLATCRACLPERTPVEFTRTRKVGEAGGRETRVDSDACLLCLVVVGPCTRQAGLGLSLVSLSLSLSLSSSLFLFLSLALAGNEEPRPSPVCLRPRTAVPCRFSGPRAAAVGPISASPPPASCSSPRNSSDPFLQSAAEA